MLVELAEVVERAGLAGGGGYAGLGWALFAVAGIWPCLLGEACVGVGSGVWFIDGAVEVMDWCAVVDKGGVYCCPNSPGRNERVEQKPSDELIINVRPSVDLFSRQ